MEVFWIRPSVTYIMWRNMFPDWWHIYKLKLTAVIVDP